MFKYFMDTISGWFSNEQCIDSVYDKCNNITRHITRADPHLADIFVKKSIQTQLFLIRWIRILFCQMFDMEDLYYIWDVIFAHSSHLSLVEHVCVVLLVLQRRKICAGDSMNAFDIYFNYPHLEVPLSFVMCLAMNNHFSGQRPLFKHNSPN